MATGTGLRVVKGLDGMNADEVASVAFRNVVLLEVLPFQVHIDPTARMAVKTVRLAMALGTVVSCLAGLDPVSPYPIGIMVGSDPFRLVAVVAFGDFHRCVLFVRKIVFYLMFEVY
jgi:hypothetical protein